MKEGREEIIFLTPNWPWWLYQSENTWRIPAVNKRETYTLQQSHTGRREGEKLVLMPNRPWWLYQSETHDGSLRSTADTCIHMRTEPLVKNGRKERIMTITSKWNAWWCRIPRMPAVNNRETYAIGLGNSHARRREGRKLVLMPNWP